MNGEAGRASGSISAASLSGGVITVEGFPLEKPGTVAVQ
jgi:hypothetical protein